MFLTFLSQGLCTWMAEGKDRQQQTNKGLAWYYQFHWAKKKKYIVHFFARLNLNTGLYYNHVPVFIVWVIWYLNKLNQCYLATTPLKNIIIG